MMMTSMMINLHNYKFNLSRLFFITQFWRVVSSGLLLYLSIIKSFSTIMMIVMVKLVTLMMMNMGFGGTKKNIVSTML